MAEWITADWHLGETRLEILQRPFYSQTDMIASLINNYNSLVKPNDTVYVVGDVVYQKTPEFLERVAHFNGKKILFRGNHDRIFTDAQLSPYFVDIVPEGEGMALDIKGEQCYITHYPTCGKVEFFNLVGHVHGSWRNQLNMLNIGVDVHHFYPVSLDKIPFYIEATRNFYDEDVWVGYENINMNYRFCRGKKGRYFNR